MVMAATPAGNEEELRGCFLPLADPQERLALIVDACAGTGLPEALRTESRLVPGCVSRVWLCGGAASDGRLQLEWDAESPLVRGLAGLICRIYQGVPVEKLAGFRSRILTDLGLDRQLSPTRLRGLAAVELRIHQLVSG